MLEIRDQTSATDCVRALSQQAAALGIALRQPPPEPQTCCGRGCNGCVWESWYDALNFWRDDALQALAESRGDCMAEAGQTGPAETAQ